MHQDSHDISIVLNHLSILSVYGPSIWSILHVSIGMTMAWTVFEWFGSKSRWPLACSSSFEASDKITLATVDVAQYSRVDWGGVG